MSLYQAIVGLGMSKRNFVEFCPFAARSVYELCDPDDPDVASTYKSLYFQIQETTMAELLNKTG